MSSDQLLADLHKLLSSITLGDLPQPKPVTNGESNGVIETYSDTRLRDVVSLLLKHNISSCPVRKAEYKDKDAPFTEAYLGVVDLLDIVAFVLAIVKTTAKWGKGFEAVLEAVVQFAEHTVQDVIDASPVAAFQFVSASASLLDALKLLGKDRFHRVIVTDDKEHMKNILTQSAMLAYLSNRVKSDPAFKAFADRSIAELGMGKEQNVVGIPIFHKAVDAFHLIHANRVTGVPIVDKHGSLVGNISARDIRSMVGSPDKFDRLFDSISEFLSDIQQDRSEKKNTTKTSKPACPSSPFAKKTATPVATVPEEPVTRNVHWSLPSAVTVTTNDSLAYVLQLLVQHRIHRVYIVKGCLDDDGTPVKKPIGVVTLTDVMHVFTEGVLKNNNEQVAADANINYSKQ